MLLSPLPAVHVALEPVFFSDGLRRLAQEGGGGDVGWMVDQRAGEINGRRNLLSQPGPSACRRLRFRGVNHEREGGELLFVLGRF